MRRPGTPGVGKRVSRMGTAWRLFGVRPVPWPVTFGRLAAGYRMVIGCKCAIAPGFGRCASRWTPLRRPGSAHELIEVRDREIDKPVIRRVDETLVDQIVPARHRGRMLAAHDLGDAPDR